MRQIQADVARLFCAWDPLAMRGLSGWQKTYDEYAGPVAVLVKKRAAVEDIARALAGLMANEWKLPPDARRCREFAEKMWRAGAFLDSPTT